MSKATETEPTTFDSISNDDLETVAGGKSSNDQITAALTQVTSSIKDIASSKNNSSGGDMTTMLLMMMAMNNGGGGGVVGGTPAVAAAPSVINVSTSVKNGRRRGKCW